jgi:hypothetical protein
MATFLQLCQRVAGQSGTIPGNQPATVTGLTGRLEKVAIWVNMAWENLQNSRAHWQWMQDEFEAPTIQGVARYTAAAWSLPRLAEWVTADNTATLYRQSEGRAQEAPITFMDYRDFRAVYDRGVHDQSQPINFSVSPANEFCLGATPDAVYVVRGLYRKTPQTLTAAGDIPEMPARFHDLIVWDAEVLLAEHDEAQVAMAVNTRRADALRRDLMRDQLPIPRTHGAAPLA